MRLILIEDNARLGEAIGAALQKQGFAVDRFTALTPARQALAAATYDLILLDLGMPDGDGVEFLSSIRAKGIMTPVLVITARQALGDRVRGLDAGADDYLVKPFATDELAARCRALLRRPGGVLGTVLEVGNVALNCASREVRVAGRVIDMPPRETAFLEELMRHAGRVVTKSAIESSLYALRSEVSTNAIDTIVSRLRRRLAAVCADVTIHTAHGIGYLLSAPPAKAQTAS